MHYRKYITPSKINEVLVATGTDMHRKTCTTVADPDFILHNDTGIIGVTNFPHLGIPILPGDILALLWLWGTTRLTLSLIHI